LIKPLETRVALEKTLFLRRFKSVSFDTPCDVFIQIVSAHLSCARNINKILLEKNQGNNVKNKKSDIISSKKPYEKKFSFQPSTLFTSINIRVFFKDKNLRNLKK
jgi:hypothetical protein